MIALPEWAESAINATPEKVAAFSGVWPISSVRNVMVAVKDTLSFIAKAREIHGDRYDYSRTVYTGSNKPITITCRKCGDVVIAEAKSHLRKKHPSGCTASCGRSSQRIQKVFDTESFVAAGRKIHGDTYGYEKAAYVSADKPITIVCRKCGPVTLSQAQSHYRKRNPCGCKRCVKMERLHAAMGDAVVCKGCGLPEPYRVSGYCKKCRDAGVSRREVGKAETNKRLKRQCKKCGIDFSSRDRSYCSDDCRKAAAVPITHTKCGICGKDVAKKNHLGSSVLFCGGRCQRIYASSCQPSWKDWIAASKKAKQKWYRARSRERYMRSFHRKLSLLASSDYTPREKTWRDKFNSIVQCNKHREELSVIRVPVVKQRKQGKWQRSDVAAWQCRFRSLSVVRKVKGLVTWKDKLNNIAGNQRRRMKTKSLRQRLKESSTSSTEGVTTVE